MSLKFKKTKEDFVCEKCGQKMKGTGYTNHCARCLWSKHVDINPGDRLAECGGLMEPIDIYWQNPDWIIIHQCQKCDSKSKNRICPEDDFNVVVELEKKINEKKIKSSF